MNGTRSTDSPLADSNWGFSSQNSSFELAVAVIRERIASLSAEDKDDLFALLPSLLSQDVEERAAAGVAINEILNQTTGGIQRVNLQEPSGDSLNKWLSWVSEKIKSLRKEAGLTQEELAEKSGLPQSHISRLENREHSPTAKTLQKIADALGVEAKLLDPSAM